MNKNDLFRAFDNVDDSILERSETTAARRRAPVYRKWLALAACLTLMVSLVGVAFAAEAKEYGAAMAFFDENGLSTEGLSRSDVKAVYRDITSQHFTYDKTAEVIERAVPGLEIGQRQPTPEELAALWDRNVWRNTRPETGFSYRVDVPFKLNESLGFDVLDRSVLECYRDRDPIWTAEFPDLYVEGCVHTSAGTAVWGFNYTWSGEQPVYSSVIRVDDGGNILWQKQLDHGFRDELISHVLDNGDGTWAVVSLGDFEYLCLSQYDVDGNELFHYATEVGNYGIWNVVRLGDGYLAQLGNIEDGETARLVKLNRNGELLDTFTYQGEDCNYVITDMIEFGGRVYLSAYAVPKQTDGGGRHEIADILAYLYDNYARVIPSEELTPMLRDNYTAVLLLCDPEGGAPETFYSVEGSLGGKLAVNDTGKLAWDVESIVDTFYCLYTSSFTIGGTCQVFCYTFDDTGTLLSQEDTGEIVPYHR